ncbi:hypothetical protein POM88_005156 [Heracleum sosnowskyi]|uniref:Uncharacterized protein n=1 Tax=Heracleum sosnowskyi TaxID=360622 RepID=A0AAD8JMZ6_9APIA|nr:hypothetical protein POM88_005156 [Heracleum sosnowskyi]
MVDKIFDHNFTEKIEEEVQTVEDIVETVEEMAEKVEKIAEGFMEDLPDGKLKTAVGLFEHAAEVIAKDARQIDSIIDKQKHNMWIVGGLPSSWRGWLVGMVVTVVIPLMTNKWGTLSKWTRKIEAAVQKVEDIVEAVEEVAEKVEKIAEDIIDDLPDGKLKTAVGLFEHAAEVLAKDAKQFDNIIDKFQEEENKLQAYIEEQRNATTKEDKDA